MSGCADIQSDGRNCGACDHSCLGGRCRGGRCLPEVLTTGSPAKIAVDGTRVYWVDGQYGSVMRCPVDSCQSALETLFPGPGGASGGFYEEALAVQGGQVFFAEMEVFSGASALYSCPATGCASSPDTVFSAQALPATGPAIVASVATDAQNVYWTYGQNVYECPIGGCDGRSPTLLVAGAVEMSSGPWALAAKNGSIYFADSQAGVGGCSVASGCACAPASEGACMLDPSTTLEADAVAAGASGVYWTSRATNQVFAVPLAPDAGGSSDGVFATAAAPGSLAVDANDVYFTTRQNGGAIDKCAVGGCNGIPTVVASGLGPLGDLQVDAQRVYVVVGTVSDPAQAPYGVVTLTGTAIVWIAK